MGRGDGGDGLPPPPPPKFGPLRFFGQQEKFGQSQFLKKFACVFVRVVVVFFFGKAIFRILICGQHGKAS